MISANMQVIFDTGKITKLNTLAQIKSFADVSKDYTCSVSIELSYMVKFNYSSKPMRQSISLSARANGAASMQKRELNETVRRILFPVQSDNSSLKIEIQYSDVSFSEDIINLLSNHINASFHSGNEIYRKIKTTISYVYPIAFVGVIFSMVVIMERARSGAVAHSAEKNKALFENGPRDLDGVVGRVDAIYKTMVALKRPVLVYRCFGFSRQLFQ